ncbi:MAG: hypothetical protein WA637_13595, partial [Terriglobales bacterium]
LLTRLVGSGTPQETIPILPSAGMPLNSMLHPTHPARRAVGLRGLRFSIVLSVKNTLGISSTFSTHHSLVYCNKIRFGAVSDRIARIIALYPASTTLFGFQFRRLFSWKDCSHFGQVKSMAGVFVLDRNMRLESQAGQ